MNKTNRKNVLFNFLIVLLVAVVCYRSSVEFHDIAWGTGNWLGEFSPIWAVLYYSFVAFCVLVISLTALFVWGNRLLISAEERIIAIRQKLGALRWLLWIVILAVPVWFFQYTAMGFVFQKFHIRVLIWIIAVCMMTILASKREQLAGWNEFLASLILTASVFSIAASLKYVNDYPFSLGWSEGNRLWDYSVLFGRDRYIYPADKDIPVLLDLGRNLVGGLPFIFPGTTITMARLWVGLTLIVPYLLLGVALFRADSRNKVTWGLLVLWTFLFLKQGPIHAPLVLGAAAVALAWNAPLWYAAPLVTGAGYFVQASRFTWVFAPTIWIVMLEFASAIFTSSSTRKVVFSIWMRALLLGVLGVFGAFVLPNMFRSAGLASSAVPPVVSSPTTTPYPSATRTVPTQAATATVKAPTAIVPTSTPAAESGLPSYLETTIRRIQDQPLLWYRLLPNSTYDNGILLALLLAIVPLTIVLIYLSAKGIWHLNRLQKTTLILPLLAFLIVGLVASAKIGGGGDLHNMDMFLVGMLFVGALAWRNGGGDWIQNSGIIPVIMKVVIVTLLVNSSIGPLLEMRSYHFGEDMIRLRILSDADIRSTLEMLPTQDEIDSAIQTIQKEADKAKSQGDVLFMDQRQLLTFGYITGIPLVPEYEKKAVMNQALRSNARYFQGYYDDLAAKRFSLIITEPLRTPIQDSSYQFGEENNAWVKWVANPTLCYYEPLETLKTIRVQLLVPKQGVVDCSAELP
jgi:hypothetical protein